MDKKFKILSEEYLLSLLNEAPNDQQQTAQTTTQNTTMTQDPNATFEPNEQDASMGVENDMGEGDMGMDAGMDGGDGMGDDMGGGDMGGNDGMGGDPMANPTNVKDIFKKRKLFKDYKELLETIEDSIETVNKMNTVDLPKDPKKILDFINGKMEENREKLLIILTEQYMLLSYQQLLTIYMYIKIATKSYADMVKQIDVLYIQEK